MTEGYVVEKRFAEITAAVMIVLGGRGRIVAAPHHIWEFCVEDVWCYASLAGALAAFEAWNGLSEGWIRHPQSARRRPNGDPTKEYIAP